MYATASDRNERDREIEREVRTASDKNTEDHCKEMKNIRAELRMAYQRDKELCLCTPNMPKWVLLANELELDPTQYQKIDEGIFTLSLLSLSFRPSRKVRRCARGFRRRTEKVTAQKKGMRYGCNMI